MAIHTQQTGVESEQRYSPEEAGEILKLAANLQDDSFTLEQLRAIAREAGIDDQQLSRALVQHEQLQQQKLLQQQEKRRRRKRWLVGAGVALVLAMLFASSSVSWVTPAQRPAGFTPTGSEVSMFPATPPPEISEKTLLASSRSCTVYKVKDRSYERVIIVRPNREEFTVGHQFERVSSASISPTGRHIALFDEEAGEVWVVDVNGEGLHSVARLGEVRGGDVVTSEGNPIAGWATYEGKDRLKVRLVGGGYAYMFVEQ